MRSIRNRKLVSILLTLSLLVTLLVPMVGPASAYSTYTAQTVASVSPGSWYSVGATWNRVTVEIPEGSLAAGATATVRVSLPTDFAFTLNDNGVPANAAVNTWYNLANNNGAIPATVASNTNNQIASARVRPISGLLANGGVNCYKEWELEVTGAAAAAGTYVGKGIIYLDLTNVFVPASASTDINLYFDAAPGSVFSSQGVLVARSGSGVVSIAIDSVKAVTSGIGAIDVLKIKEDRPNALQAATDSIKIKLPNGFKWSAGATTTATVSTIWGNVAAVPGGANGNYNFTVQDDGRTLLIPSNGNSGTATYYSISGLNITVDESTAKYGDIECTISGKSTVQQSTIVVGKYGEYGLKVYAVGDPKTVMAGKQGEEIGSFALEELVRGSLINGRTVTLTLTGGAKWNGAAGPAATPSNPPILDASQSNLYGIGSPNAAWVWSGSTYDAIKWTVAAPAAGSTDAAKIVLQKAQIDVSAAASGDIKIIVSGTAGATGEVVVAKVQKPVTVKVDGEIPNLVAGASDQALPDIIVEENVKEAIQSANAAGAYTPFSASGGAGGINPGGGLFIEFPSGMFPSSLGTVTVTDGDLTIDPTSLAKAVTADGRWVVGVSVKSTSSTPSKIKFSGIKLRVDREYAEGNINVAVKGNLVQTAGATLFPGATAAAVGTVAKVVTPAPGEQKFTASFKIGDTKYTLNGVEKTMDVAPYIKSDRTYMPLRFAAQAAGVADSNIMWNDADQSVVLIKGDRVVKLTIGSKSMLINGVTFTMDVAPEIVDPGRTMLPVRWVAQALGANVTWDEATQTVTVK